MSLRSVENHICRWPQGSATQQHRRSNHRILAPLSAPGAAGVVEHWGGMAVPPESPNEPGRRISLRSVDNISRWPEVSDTQ